LVILIVSFNLNYQAIFHIDIYIPIESFANIPKIDQLRNPENKDYDIEK